MENIEPPKLEALRHATVFDEPAGPDLAIPKHALTPPTSEDMERRERSSSELSECEGDHNVEEDIEPDHYYGGGRVPVFKPVCQEFSISRNRCRSKQHFRFGDGYNILQSG